VSHAGSRSDEREVPLPYVDSQLCKIESEATQLSCRCHRKRNRFRFAHYAVGGTAAVLAGAASVSALQQIATGTVAVLAGLAGALSAMQLFLQPAENAERHHQRYVRWQELAASIHDKRTLEVPSLSSADAREELRKCRGEFYRLRRSEPIT